MHDQTSHNLQGNLLDDTDLIRVLATTKAAAGEVAERLAGANETDRQIRAACEEFRPVAQRATVLYFLMADFSIINCMYQTSLPQVMLISRHLLRRLSILPTTTVSVAVQFAV